MADDNDKLRKVSVTNKDGGPRFLHTSKGMEVVPSGATLETEMSGTQLRAIRDERVTGTDDVDRWDIATTKAAAPAKEKALKDHPVAELRKIAEAESVPLTGRTDSDNKPLPDLTSAAEIAAAIEAKRAAA